MPLTSDRFQTAFGSLTAVDTVLVRLRADSHEVWAETCPFGSPIYSPEWAGGVFACLRDCLVPDLVGSSVAVGDELQARLSRYRGNYFAKAALDIGFWLLEAEQRRLPLHRLLGGSDDDVEIGEALGVMDTVEDLLQAVSRAVDRGYRRVKLKIQPGWDLTPVRSIRDAFPGLPLHVDCNAGYTLKDLPMFRELDRCGLSMIEQPLSYGDLLDHAKLQQELETGLCLDESIRSLSDVRHAIELGSCRFVNVKPGRVGGLTTAVQIIAECARSGIRCWVGGMLESALGAAICAELATVPNIAYTSDIAPTPRFYEEDLCSPILRCHRKAGGGLWLAPANGPGVPQRPRSDRLEALTVQSAWLSAGTVAG